MCLLSMGVFLPTALNQRTNPQVFIKSLLLQSQRLFLGHRAAPFRPADQHPALAALGLRGVCVPLPVPRASPGGITLRRSLSDGQRRNRDPTGACSQAVLSHVPGKLQLGAAFPPQILSFFVLFWGLFGVWFVGFFFS